MIKAVLFDLDGTLIDSIEDLADSTNFALEKFSFPTHKVEKFRYFIGDGMSKLIERALPEVSRNTETIIRVKECFMEHYRSHFADKTYVYEGIPELLARLKDNGLKLAVLSNKANEMVSVIIEKLFGECFDVVYGKVEGYATKPDPELAKRVLEELNVTPEECVMVGDSGMDAAMAVNLGCIGIGVLWGFRTQEELLQNGAHYIANNPDEVFDIVKKGLQI